MFRCNLVVGTIVILGCLVVANLVSAESNNGNPFAQVLAKLDQILLQLGSNSHDKQAQRWDQHLPAGMRFTVLAAFNHQAVLDNDTGLVWEQSPGPSPANFQDSTYGCANKVIGGLKGWRLPSVPELGSLVDPSVLNGGPTLQPGHPFHNVQSTYYWTSNTHAVTPSTAWTLTFATGNFGSDNKMGGSHPAWCVRGPMNADAY